MLSQNLTCCQFFRRFFLPVTMVLVLNSCEEFVSVPEPGTTIMRKNVFESDETAIAAVSAIYGQLASDGSFAFGETSFNGGVYADELISFAPLNSSANINNFYFNTVTPINSFVSSTWTTCYSVIFSSNLILEGLSSPNRVSMPLARQLKGEALFVRAFCHFSLVNFFGDVPLIETTDYRFNTGVSRTHVDRVYESIIKDLLDAKSLLTDAYPSPGRVRVNKGAATALLSRAYLYAEDYANAEAQATEIINNTAQYKLHEDLKDVFLKSSSEAIWQLLPKDNYTIEGRKFIIVAAPPQFTALKNTLFNAFETNDNRRTEWISAITSESGISTWYYPFKYKENHLNATGSEHSMVLRMAEQILIRAEARAQQNKLAGSNSAASDIDMIRNRAGLGNTTASTKSELLTVILNERRLELFGEWGHRFFDLKRMGKLNEVMSIEKNTWKNHFALLPIPQSEIQLNPNLQPQNPGY